MKTQFTLLFVSCFLLVGVWLSGNGQTGNSDAVDLARTRVERCLQRVMEAKTDIAGLKVDIKVYEPGPNAAIWEVELHQSFKDQLREYDRWRYEYVCRDLDESLTHYENAVADSKRSPTPTPSPTPPYTGPPIAPLDPNSPPNVEEIKKSKELLDKLGPLSTDINDWVKKQKAKLPPVKAPDGLVTDTRRQPGLQTVSFDMPQGQITVNLPDDIRAGDTISGTVMVEPKGPTESERNQNSTAWQNLAIELIRPDSTIVHIPLSTIRNNFVFVTGPDPGNGTIGCNLVTRNGADLANVRVPVSPAAPPVTPNATTPRPANFQFPSLGQTGRLLEINGAFDGSSANTQVTAGGKPANTLAESPRKCVFESPRDVTGPTEVQVNEGGREGRGAYRNIDVRLSSPKLNLTRGEKTTITVVVTGLSGIQSDVPLQLEKTGTVTMERGDVQHIQIRPQDVNRNGAFVLSREVTGVQAGGFNVTATVFDPTRRPVIIPLSEGSGVNGYRLIRGDGTASFGAENVIDPTTGKPLSGEHKLRAGCGQPSLPELPLLSLLFKNGNAGREKTNCFKFVTPRIIIN